MLAPSLKTNLKGRYSVEKEVFLDKLKKLVALGKSKQNALDATEINDFFAGDNLGPEQMDEIYNYLEHSNIDVVPVIDDAMLADDSMLLDDLDDDYREGQRTERTLTWMRSIFWRVSERRIRSACT